MKEKISITQSEWYRPILILVAIIFAVLFAVISAKAEKFSKEEIVAITILAEARGEGKRGMYAVACVISKRIKERKKTGAPKKTFASRTCTLRNNTSQKYQAFRFDVYRASQSLPHKDSKSLLVKGQTTRRHNRQPRIF